MYIYLIEHGANSKLLLLGQLGVGLGQRLLGRHHGHGALLRGNGQALREGFEIVGRSGEYLQ